MHQKKTTPRVRRASNQANAVAVQASPVKAHNRKYSNENFYEQRYPKVSIPSSLAFAPVIG